MCVCVSHQSPTAQKLVVLKLAALTTKGVFLSLCLSRLQREPLGSLMWSLRPFPALLPEAETFLFPFTALLSYPDPDLCFSRT